MYLISIDEKVLPLPMGINTNSFSNYFSDGILFIDYLDEKEKNEVLSDLFYNISILFCSYDYIDIFFTRPSSSEPVQIHP